MFSRTEKIILVASRTVSGTLSLVASTIIINKIVQSAKKRRERTDTSRCSTLLSSTSIYQRLLFGLSVLNCFTSFFSALSTLPVPASTGALYGHGNAQTCAVQGFFVHFGAATPVYIAALTTYFMLRIRYGMPEDVVRKKYEFWFHAVPIVVALVGASVGAALQIFNPLPLPELGCWIAPYPRNCHITGGCTRGYKMEKYEHYYECLLTFLWFFLSFSLIAVNSILIYSSMLQLEQRNFANDVAAARVQTDTIVSDAAMVSDDDLALSEIRDASTTRDSTTRDDSGAGVDCSNTAVASSQSHQRTKASRIAAVQCLLYAAAALATTAWTLPWIGQKTGAFFMNVFNPSQGVFNLIIFVRLQYLRLRSTEPEWSRWQCIQYCLFSADTK